MKNIESLREVSLLELDKTFNPSERSDKQNVSGIIFQRQENYA